MRVVESEDLHFGLPSDVLHFRNDSRNVDRITVGSCRRHKHAVDIQSGLVEWRNHEITFDESTVERNAFKALVVLRFLLGSERQS